MTPNDHEGGWAGFTMRNAIAASLLTDMSATQMRITFTVFNGAGAVLVFNHCYCNTRGSGTWDYSSAPVQVFWNGGSAGFSITAPASITSDPFSIAYDGTHDLIIGADMGTGSNFASHNSLAGTSIGFKSGADGSTTIASGYSTDPQHCFVTLIEVA
jgi:hypothetical protein